MINRQGSHPLPLFFARYSPNAKAFSLAEYLEPAFSKFQREDLMGFNGAGLSSVKNHQVFERPR